MPTNRICELFSNIQLLNFDRFYSDLGVEGGPEWSLRNIYIIEYFLLVSFCLEFPQCTSGSITFSRTNTNLFEICLET